MSSEETQSPEKKPNSSPTARSKADSWYVFREHAHFGPFTTSSVWIYLQRGFISKEHFVWKVGQSDWVRISDVKDFDVPIAEEALKMSDAEFVKISGLKRENLIDFYQQHQSRVSLESSESKAKLGGMTDLYESIKSKLNFRIKDSMTTVEDEQNDFNKNVKTEKI